MPTSSSDPLLRAARDLAWNQWAHLGVSAELLWRETRCIDPEALLWFTFAPTHFEDARLRDAAREWLSLNSDLVSIHRLRNVFRKDSRAVNEVIGVLKGTAARRGERLGAAAKAEPADPMVPANLAMRLRLIFDAGSRSEVVRFLLTWPGAEAEVQPVADGAAFAKRNVNDILTDFVRAGMLRERRVGNRRVLRIDKERWSDFVGLSLGELPSFVPWFRLFRATNGLLAWLEADRRDTQRSAYLRSSNARDFLEEVSPDLAACGVEVPDPARFPGEKFLDPFETMIAEVAGLLAPADFQANRV